MNSTLDYSELSVSARQHSSKQLINPEVSEMRKKALRQEGINWPNTLLPNFHQPTNMHVQSFTRHVTGGELLTQQKMCFSTHLLIIVYAGELTIETANAKHLIRSGSAVIVPASTIYLSEHPDDNLEVRLSILAFDPVFLTTQFSSDKLELFASRILPQIPGCYIHPRAVILFATARIDPLIEVEKAFNVLVNSLNFSILNFLRHHFFEPRRELQQMASNGISGQTYLDGRQTFSKAFQLYHGVSLDKWRKPTGKKQSECRS